MFNELEERKEQEGIFLKKMDYDEFLSSNKRFDYLSLEYHRVLDLILKLNIYNKVRHTGKNIRIINAAVQPCLGNIGETDIEYIDKNTGRFYNLKLNTLTLMLNYGVKDVKSQQLPLQKSLFGVNSANKSISNVISSLEEAGLVGNEKIHNALTGVANPGVNLRNGIMAVNNELVNLKVTPEQIEKYTEEFLADNLHVDYFHSSGAYPQEVADAHPMHKVVEDVIKSQFEVSQKKYVEFVTAPVSER
ncbi:MAG: hypothetical protein J6X00_03750 [Clostridia bacterium]|nr:hypothetical protein [Clostridia bacterium]